MTTINDSRRAFLRGRGERALRAPRMPWAVADFVAVCERCDDCIPVCETGILIRGDGGFPTVDFARGGCTFCGACADSCRSQALARRDGPAWSLRALIDSRCLSSQGISCRLCGDGCEQAAIRFQLHTGGRALPWIAAEHCNGCGGCVLVCPVQAIQVQEAA
jgi:ferredoxin-type protein NapF